MNDWPVFIQTWKRTYSEDVKSLILTQQKFTESQNFWGLEVTSWDHLVHPTPSISQAESARDSCPGCVQSGFEYLQKWRIHNFSGQTCFGL